MSHYKSDQPCAGESMVGNAIIRESALASPVSSAMDALRAEHKHIHVVVQMLEQRLATVLAPEHPQKLSGDATCAPVSCELEGQINGAAGTAADAGRRLNAILSRLAL